MSIAQTIGRQLGLSGHYGEQWHVDQRRHGPFAPLLYAAPTPEGWHLVSSPLTQTEWWTCFLPNTLCPRYGGALGIPDAYEAFCVKERCRDACNAEDGFVELRANRFWLDQHAALVEKRFPYLHTFLVRAEALVAQENRTHGLGWGLARHQHLAYLQIVVPEAYLIPHLQGLARLWPLMTGVTSTLNVEALSPIDIESLDLDQEHDLMRLARHYAEVESLRKAAEVYFADLVAERGGNQEGIEYKLPTGLRYLVSTFVECYQDDNGYMGRVEFRTGLGEIRQFVATTMGGGRW